jgi:hypothetical protein
VKRFRRRLGMPDKRQRLLQDHERCQGWMAAILHEARTLGAPDTVDLATALTIWRSWAVKAQIWVEESEQ